MRKTHVAAILVVIALVALVAAAGWRRGGPNQFEAAFNPGGTLTLDFSTGDFRVEGTSENQIRVAPNYTDRGEVRCFIDVNGSNAKVQIEGPNNHFRAVVYVPQRSDLNVNQTIGHLLVSNVVGNKNLALAIGQMDIEFPNDEPLPNFEGGLIIGDLHPTHWRVEKGGFFRSFSRSSSSPYSITAHVDIGQLTTTEIAPSHVQQTEDAPRDMPEKNAPHHSQ